MKRLAVAIALVAFVFALPVHGKSPCKGRTIEQLVGEMVEGYEARNLRKLDAKHPYAGKVKIIIQHSLLDGADEFESRRFSSFRQAERWLKSREMDGMPNRAAMALVRCEKGVCTFNFDGGIVHRVLYLKKITYGYRNGCPYIKSVLLLDGD